MADNINIKKDEIEFDNNGNLVVKNKEAAEVVKKAIDNAGVDYDAKIKILCCNFIICG